jgi:dTDP-4-amino-4,6-dideoxygalactose transaminase
MRVPFLDLAAQNKPFRARILKDWAEAFDKGAFVLGPHGAALEQEAAKLLKVKHAIAVNSGTDALVIGLRALGVGPGDEVVTTPFTFFATAEAISLVGAKPVFCDIESGSYLMDAADARKRITKKTKALLPVHLYGQPSDLSALKALAKRSGLRLLEDACQAFGAFSKSGAAGALGDAGAFSFYPTKNLGAAGDAGLLVTQQDAVAKIAHNLRNHGSDKRYYHDAVGYCSRMDEMQAIVLRAKLPHLAAWVKKRRSLAAAYSKSLAGLPGLGLPQADPSHVWHQYAVRVAAGRREELMEHLKAQDVATMVFYPLALHQQKAYASLKTGALPHAQSAASEVLCLPIFAEMSHAQQMHVIRSLRSFFRDHA